MELVQFAQQLKVVRRGFPESESYIYHELLDALLPETAHAVSKPVQDFCGDVFVSGPFLHGRWSALHVHDGIRGIELCNDLSHVSIAGTTVNVIDHKGTCF